MASTTAPHAGASLICPVGNARPAVRGFKRVEPAVQNAVQSESGGAGSGCRDQDQQRGARGQRRLGQKRSGVDER